MKGSEHYATHGPAYVPTEAQIQRDYRPDYGRYTPREIGIVRLTVHPGMVLRGKPSGISDVTDAQREQAVERRRSRTRSDPKPEPAPAREPLTERLMTLFDAGERLEAHEIAERLDLDIKMVRNAINWLRGCKRLVAERVPGSLGNHKRYGIAREVEA